MTIATKSGFGHQLRIDERSFGSCKRHIEQAMHSILDQKETSEEAKEIFEALSALFVKAHNLEYACEEKYNQNN